MDATKMKTCEIWGLDRDGNKELMGRVMLQNGRLTSQYTEGHELAMTDLLETPNVSGDIKFNSHTQPEEWFDALPDQYHGSYMWAEMKSASMQSVGLDP